MGPITWKDYNWEIQSLKTKLIANESKLRLMKDTSENGLDCGTIAGFILGT